MNANDNNAKVLVSFVCVSVCASWLQQPLQHDKADKEQSSSAWCVYEQVSVRVCAIFTGVRVQLH